MSTAGHILWADDEIDLLRSHVLFLENRGYQVTCVANGSDAVDVVALQKDVDVVLLDEQMPGMGGLETLKSIKHTRPDLPVIMVTKSEEEHLMDEALGGQISDYLTKPVNPSQILLTCKRLLERIEIRNARISQDYMHRFNAISATLSHCTEIDEWFNLYQELVHYDREMGNDEGARQVLTDQYKEANRVFGRFIEDQYPNWISAYQSDSNEHNPILSHEVIPHWVIPQMTVDRPLIFFVIDCMRYDQWLEFESLLLPLFSIQTEFSLGILPTATPYARNSIFSGLLPNEIARYHPTLWQGESEDEHSLNRYEEPLLNACLKRFNADSFSIRYSKLIGKEDGRRFAQDVSHYLRADLNAIVINFVDILAHSRADSDVIRELAPDEQAYRALTRTWFKHSWLYQSFQTLAKKDCTIIITTDHGAIRSLHGAKVLGDRNTSTALRYKFGRKLVADSRHAITVKDPQSYGLPSKNSGDSFIIAKEDYYFVYPTNYNHYRNRFNDTMQHGGVSMEEMILPVVTMRPRRS
ncbi:MAG: bifunctional response regulator/alkaline phosphatase family protein [Bacteroidetes bacterium]|nr:bifunctional response regulator/alkaline phosphatase family protein [Bacteroidota bacterium]